MIKTADWIIDLGSEAWPGLDRGGGDGGGEIVAESRPGTSSGIAKLSEHEAN